MRAISFTYRRFRSAIWNCCATTTSPQRTFFPRYSAGRRNPSAARPSIMDGPAEFRALTGSDLPPAPAIAERAHRERGDGEQAQSRIRGTAIRLGGLGDVFGEVILLLDRRRRRQQVEHRARP